MVGEIPCPKCNQLNDPLARYCDHCGVDLALAAVVAERDIIDLPEIPSGVPLAPELLVPRLGEYMLDNGLLEHKQLQAALDYQRKQIKKGRSVLLGQALLELELVDRETLDQAVTMQILQLQKALHYANIKLEQRVKERTIDLQKALDRVSELNQLKSNFIANISHELRTPLTHIKGYLDLLADGSSGELNEQQANILAILQRSEERLERLIEDLLQFSLLSRGEISLSLDPIDLSKAVQVNIERLQKKADAQKVKLIMFIPFDIPKVQADEEKITWVISQLLDNAVKFTPEHGQVNVHLAHENSRVNVIVSDSGIGIPSEKLEEIFEPFHQLDGSTTRRYGGTGLGLSMVKRILDAHGSQIRVDTAVGSGSRFEFSLPIVKEKTTVKS